MNDKHKVFQNLALISQLGISMLTPVLLCVWFGTWLRDKTGIDLVIPLILMGIFAGMRSVYVLLRSALKDSEDQKNEEG